MPRRELTETEAKHWRAIADHYRAATKHLDQIRQILLLELEETGHPLDLLDKCEEALAGNAYMHTPQSEWMGGTDGPTKVRAPHICEVRP